MLPNNYIHVNKLTAVNIEGGLCFNTGIVPSNTLTVKAMFSAFGNVYIFGARDTSSTSSNGQFGFMVHSSNLARNYVLYNTAQTAFTSIELIQSGIVYLENLGNEFSLNTDNWYVYNVTATDGTFTGSQPIYLGALNDAGAVNFGTTAGGTTIIAFKFYRNGNLIADYVPVYDTGNSRFGLYDQLNGTFLANMQTTTYDTHFTLEVRTTEGGEAYIETQTAGRVKKQVCFGQSDTIKAIPIKGYRFLNWTDQNGNVFSNESSVKYNAGGDTYITAHFIKEAEANTDMGFTLFGIQYGFGLPDDATDPDGRSGQMYARVKGFSIKEDGLSKQVSSIECFDVPSGFIVGCVVALMSPKGEVFYIGVINSIENNTIYCREVLSLFDVIYIFRRYMNSQHKTIQYFIMTETSQLKQGSLADISSVAQAYLVKRKYMCIGSPGSAVEEIHFNRPVLFSMPTHNASIENMEEYFFKIFNDYGLYIRPSIKTFTPSYESLRNKGEYKLLSMYTVYDANEPLVFGDNVECISNISVQTESEHTTLLFVLDEAVTNFRAAFSLKNDGTVEKIADPMSETGAEQYIAYNECVPKIIWSDDALNTLVEGNLVNGIYNHKITFEIDLSSELFRFEDLNIGRRVNFYYKNKMYNSVITAREFSSVNNRDTINSIRITLGKVRNKLTDKLGK